MSGGGGCAPSGRSEGRSSCAGRGEIGGVDSAHHGGDARAEIALCDVTGAENVGDSAAVRFHTVERISTVSAGEVVITNLGGEFLTLANVGCGRAVRFAIQALNLRFDDFFSDGLHFAFFFLV